MLIRVALAAVAGMALMLGGCASTQSVMRYHPEAAAPVAVVWPAPPDVPRYEYVGELVGEDNFQSINEGIATAGTRFLKWLVGLSSNRHVPTVLQRPQGGVVDPAGRVYVTDVSRQAVYVFDEVAGDLQVWDMASASERFLAPIGVVLGANDEVWVADAELKAVIRLDADGKPLGKIGLDQLTRPTGLARDAERGRLYVADTHSHDIKVFDDSGVLLATLGRRGEAPGEFNSPTYLAFAQDRLYVSDTLNARVQVLSTEGEALAVFGERGVFVGDMPRPKGVSVDKDGNIYVVETYFDYLLIFNAKGELLLPLGGTGSNIGEFYLPAGVWTDHRDRVYIADSFNGRVVIIQFLRGGHERQATTS